MDEPVGFIVDVDWETGRPGAAGTRVYQCRECSTLSLYQLACPVCALRREVDRLRERLDRTIDR